MSNQDQMDIRPHQEMWNNFTRLLTWAVVTLVTILALMAAFLT